MGAESLQAACELAFVVAREDTESGYEIEPPASMRSFLYVADLPRRAISIAQQAIEDDSDFRSRVAVHADEQLVGRAGFLWLHRPGGWAQEFEQLTAEDEYENEQQDPHEYADSDDYQDDYEDSDDRSPDGTVLIPDEVLDAPDGAVDTPDDVSENTGDAQDGFGSDWTVNGDGPPEPDPELEEVYNDLTADLASEPLELVSAQPPEPMEPDYSFDPGETFSPESPPISDAPMASVSLIGGQNDNDPPPPSFELASTGTAAVTDRAEYDIVEDSNFTPFSEGDGVVMQSNETDFEADALENELSSLRGLVDRLAGEREMVVSNLPAEAPADPVAIVPTVGGRELENEIMALESDLDSARHELTMAQADLATARHDREEAQRLQSQALKRQVDLEKELASVREQRVEVENQASEAQVAAISLEDKLTRTKALQEEADRERNVTKSQLETMTSERNQIREDRVAIKAERDDLFQRVTDFEQKTEGIDVTEMIASNRSMTIELEATSRELARIVAQAESFEEQIKTTTATADALKTAKVELTSRLADTELALETTRTQHEALKTDSERLAAEVGTLRAERDGLQTQLTELQASLADVLSEQAESRQRNDADRQALNELRIERDVLMARMNDLEAADRDYEARIKTLVSERDDLVAARDDLITERGQLRGEAAASVAEKDQLHDKLSGVESKIGPLETELQAERRQREELANRLLELDDIAEQNSAELARLTEDRESMSASLDELRAERVDVGELRVERDSLASQLTESESRYEGELAQNRDRLTEMSEQLAAGEAARTALEQQIAEATSELDSIRVEHSNASSELSRLSASEDQVNIALTDAQASIEALRSELESTREARAEAEAHLALADESRLDIAAQLESQKRFAAEKAEETENALAEARFANEARVAAETEAAVSEARMANEARIAAEALVDAEERATDAASAAAAANAAAEAAASAAAAAVADKEDATAALSLGAEPIADPDIKIGSSETVSLDLAAMPSPFTSAEPESKKDSDDAEDESAASSAKFDWPPQGRAFTTRDKDVDAKADADVDLDADSDTDSDTGSAEDKDTKSDAEILAAATSNIDSKPPTILSAPSQIADDEAATVDKDQDLDEDEDDLDEVSELIAQTVSGFTQGEPILDMTDPLDSGTAETPKVDLDAASSAEAEADAKTDDDATQVLADVGSGPPSIFGAGPAIGPTGPEQLDNGARRQPGRKRRQIEIPSDVLDDEVAVAQFVVSSPDVVLLVDGDSVAKLGWPSYAVAQQRDALVTYLADLSASSGAAPDVVFDGRIGDDESLPASRAVRIRLSTPPTEPAAALDELVDAYPEQWPIALVTDDPDLAASAGERGAAVLNNGQLLDLFISE